MAWLSRTNHNCLLRIPTNEIASFCIDDRLRQMAFFFVFAKVRKGGAKTGFCVMLKYWEIKKKNFNCSSLFRYYIKQINSMLPCVCLVIDHRRRQNSVRTSVIHSAIASCATFLFLPHFDVFCDLLLNRRTATWNLFVKDVRAHCYCSSLVRTLHMTWRVPRHVFQARAPSRNSTKYRADDLCGNLICEYLC